MLLKTKRETKEKESVLDLFLLLLILQLLLVGLDQLSLLLGLDLLVTEVLHRELTLALGLTTDLGGITEHGVQGDLGHTAEVILARLGVDNGSLALVDASNDSTLEFDGGSDVDLHDGLHDHGVGLHVSVLEGVHGSNLESQLGRINSVGGSVLQNHAHTGDGVTDQETLLHTLLETLLTGRDKVGGDVASNNSVLEEGVDALLVHLGGLDEALDTTILTSTSRLLLVGVVELGTVLDGFSEGDLRLAGDAVDVVLTTHTLDVNLEMQLSHARDNSLLGLAVDVDLEGRILLLEAVQGLGEVGGLLALGLEGQGNNGVGYEHGGHGVLEGTVGKSVSRGAVNTEHGANLSWSNLVDILELIGVHANQTGDLDLLVVLDVGDESSAAEHSLVDTQVGQLTEATLLQFESQSDKGILVTGGQFNLGLLVLDIQSNVGDLVRAGKETADSVQERLDTLVLDSRAHHDGDELAGNGGATNSLLVSVATNISVDR